MIGGNKKLLRILVNQYQAQALTVTIEELQIK